MVNNSTNINKTEKAKRVLVYNSTNINTAKESLNNDGVQFDQYQLIKKV